MDMRLKDATLRAALPDTMAVFLTLHDLRLQSATAHPRTAKTGRPTRRLKHRDFYSLPPVPDKGIRRIRTGDQAIGELADLTYIRSSNFLRHSRADLSQKHVLRHHAL